MAARLSSSRLPKEAKMLCWLIFGDHAAFGRGMLRVEILIFTGVKQPIPHRAYPTEGRETTLPAPPLGAPNALLANIWRPRACQESHVATPKH